MRIAGLTSSQWHEFIFSHRKLDIFMCNLENKKVRGEKHIFSNGMYSICSCGTCACRCSGFLEKCGFKEVGK